MRSSNLYLIRQLLKQKVVQKGLTKDRKEIAQDGREVLSTKYSGERVSEEDDDSPIMGLASKPQGLRQGVHQMARGIFSSIGCKAWMDKAAE